MVLRSIRLSPKHVLLSACLLVVLASGTAVHIAAQQTTWAITLGLILTFEPGSISISALDLLVNGMPYCISLDPSSSLASSIQSKETVTLQQLSEVIPLDGLYVYEGTCDAPGPLVGPITGTLTFDGQIPGPFSVVLVYTVGFPGLMSYHSEWKFTGTLQADYPPPSCVFENVVSDASVSGAGLGGIGLNVGLQLVRLEPESGACSFDDDNEILWFPTFVYSVSNVSPVVGGVVIPANNFALVSPWLAVIGLVGCIGTVVVVAKKRQP